MARNWISGGYLFLLFIFLNGCLDQGGDGEVAAVTESFEANSASKITADSFDLRSIRSILDWEFTDMLAETAEFTYDYYDSAPPDETDACIDAKIGAFRFVRNSRNSFTLSVEDTDVKDCFDATVDRYIISALYEDLLAKDLEGNMIDLAGRSLAEAYDFWPVQFRFRHFEDIAFTASDQTAMRVVYREATHASARFGDPCVNEGRDSCTTETAAIIRYPDNPALDYADRSVIASHSLGIVPGAPYYAGGTFSFQFNNWSGTMTYADSAFIPPTYTATNGVNTVTGTYLPLAPAFKAETLKGAIKSGMLKAARRAALKRRY